MKRFVNVRLPVIIAFALIAGILLGYLFIRVNISLFYIITIVPAIAVIFILCIVFSKKKLFILSLSVIIFFAGGAVYSFLRLDSFDTKELVNGDSYTVSATVCEKGNYDGGEYVIVKNAVADGQKINGKIIVYLSSAYGEYCAVGYKVNFTASINSYDTFPYGKMNYNALKNIKYRCNVYSGLTSTYSFSLFGSVNTAIYNALYKNLDSDTASVAYAMLTGNTEGIEDGTLTAFRYGGVAHIFAVSGLHIGLIYGILRLFCRKLRLNRYASLAVCIVPIFLYAGVCGFTVSSVRALIMCGIASLSHIAFAKYDALNSLSLAVAVILLINPLNLFNAGFQLSVCAVCSIISLAKNIVLPFKKVPQKLKSAVGVSLSAQAGTMPVMLARFGYLSGAGLILNILIVPLLSVLFAIEFTATFLALILPFTAQYVLPYATIPLQAVISFLTNTGFEKALLRGFGAGAFVPVYFFALLALSDKVNLKIKYRLICVFCALAVLITYIPVKNNSPFNGHKIVVSAYFGGGEVVIKSKDKNILIVTENLNFSQTDALLNRYYATNITALIILGGENCVSVCGNFNIDCDAYIYGNYLNIQPFKDKTVNYENEFSVAGVNFKFIDGYSLSAECDGATLFVCPDYCEVKNTVISFNDRNFDNCVYNDGDFVFNLKN